MINFLKSNWIIVLILAFILITLFPPFNWYLGSTQNSYAIEFGTQLPIKSYDFIFNSSVKLINYQKWDWDNSSNSSVKINIEVPLQRAIILYELILNYVLSTLIIFLFYTLNEKIKLRKK